MNVKLVKNENLGIAVNEMKDGDIGIIVQWQSGFYLNQIVQRCGESLISIGKPQYNSWPKLFKSDADFEKLRVRLLKAGDTIEVTD